MTKTSLKQAQAIITRRRNWQKGVRRPSPTLWKYFSLWGQRSPRFDKALDLHKVGLNIAKSIEHQTYMATEDYKRLVDEMKSRALKDPDYFKLIADRCYAACSTLITTAQDIRRKTEGRSLTPSELNKYFTHYHDATLSTIPFRYGILILDEILTEATNQAIATDLSINSDEAEALIPELCPVPARSFEAEYTKHIQVLVRKFKVIGSTTKARDSAIITKLLAEDETNRKLNKLLDDFSWLRTSYFTGQSLSIDDVAQDIVKMLHKNDIELGDEAPHNSVVKYKKKLLPKSRKLLKQISRYIHLRSYRIAICYKADFTVRGLLEKTAEQLDISYKQLTHMTGLEITDSLKAGYLTVDPNELGKRIEAYEIYMTADHIWAVAAVSHGQKAAPATNAKAVVSGRTAFPGKATGPVALISGKRDIKKIIPGVVVVSTMTTTDLTVALESNAAAIVTDEGGMMSHAAIISRENKIPCVVGTGDATRRFQDDDIIEVDAAPSNGVARLIKRLN